jgi:hypothetical protein
MKYFVILALSIFLPGLAATQHSSKFLRVFFVNQFDNDSVQVYLNKKRIFSAKLITDPSTGQCNKEFVVKRIDSTQRLVFKEVKTGLNQTTKIKNNFQYLYVFKLDKNNYRFDYSNKLHLPE